MKTQTEQNILKGCQCFLEEDDFQEDDCFEHNIYCGTEIKENVMLCPTCKGKLEGYQLAQKETAKKIEKLKEEIRDYDFDFIVFNKLNKIFNEDKSKEVMEK